MSFEDLQPWFVGGHGENHALLEDLIVESLRDHLFWRRNFHPEANPAIPASARYRDDYTEFVARLRDELYRLSADLKQSVPFFSPRYIGHMASDLVLPGLVARITTELYNPNNVSEEASPVTLSKEIEVGKQLAVMLGYEVDGAVRAGGHLTSGGTIANYEGLRNLMSCRLYPLAVLHAVEELGIDLEWRGELVRERSEQALVNLSVGDVIDLRDVVHEWFHTHGVEQGSQLIEQSRVETLGLVEFHRRHPGLGPLRVMIASTAHYSWEKAMKLMGLGTAQLIGVPVDAAMRLDPKGLRRELERAQADEACVIAVVPILGSTEYGAIDPVHEVVALREEFAAKSTHFGVHVDAAWGGYLRTLFKASDGSLRPRSDIAQAFRYFPSAEVYDAFLAVARSDSATVDPHKLGFIPFGAGAYVARDFRLREFARQEAAYVFDPEAQRLAPLGQFSLEGSKPGAAVASAYVTHRTIPLDETGFGKIIEQSVRSCELFWDLVRDAAAELAPVATLAVPFEPDTNLVCLALNPAGNTRLSVANELTRQVLADLRVDAREPVQVRQFFASSTKLPITTRNERLVFEALELDPADRDVDHLLMIRHTLMNPWLLAPTQGEKTSIELYIEYLVDRVRTIVGARIAE